MLYCLLHRVSGGALFVNGHSFSICCSFLLENFLIWLNFLLLCAFNAAVCDGFL